MKAQISVTIAITCLLLASCEKQLIDRWNDETRSYRCRAAKRSNWADDKSDAEPRTRWKRDGNGHN